MHFWRVSEVQWTWEVRLRPLHECNDHTIFFRFLGYLALHNASKGVMFGPSPAGSEWKGALCVEL